MKATRRVVLYLPAACFSFLVASGEKMDAIFLACRTDSCTFTRSRTPVLLARFFANGASKTPPVSLSGPRSGPSRREAFPLLPGYLVSRQAFLLLAPAAKPSSGAFFSMAGLSSFARLCALRMAFGSPAGLLCVIISPSISSPVAGP